LTKETIQSQWSSRLPEYIRISIDIRSCDVRYSADPVKGAWGGVLVLPMVSGCVGRDLDDEISVESCADSFQ
jgi:hypothetical protein